MENWRFVSRWITYNNKLYSISIFFEIETIKIIDYKYYNINDTKLNILSNHD